MSDKQIWQTIALDLKRGANYSASGSKNKADYYLAEAKSFYEKQKKNEAINKIEGFIKFEGDPEDILLGGSLILNRI